MQNDPLNNEARPEIDPNDIEWINGFPTPPSQPVRPLHAISSVLRLVRNKEDTRQVFEIIKSLSGRSGKRLFERFSATPYGRRVVSEPVLLEEILSDREALRSLPAGTLGRAYLDFMEGENLTAEGLRSAAEEAGIELDAWPEFKEFMRTFMHLQVSHDLWHVLTGYGRDALGELCNLVYTRAQTGNTGFRLIVIIGAIAQKIEAPHVPILKALREAGSNARAANWVLEYDVEQLLSLPLDEARRAIGLREPKFYNAIPADVKSKLLKPKVNETQSERERAKTPIAA